MRLPDGDIILRLRNLDDSESSLNSRIRPRQVETKKGDRKHRQSSSSKRNYKDGNGEDKDEFWESGMVIGEFVRCKGVVSCDSVSAESLYRGLVLIIRLYSCGLM